MKLRFLGDLAKLKKCLLRTGVAGQWRELPTLDIEASLAIVEATHGFVDLYKVGRVNYLPMTKTTDWRDYTLRVLDTLNRVNARHYIKKDCSPSFRLAIRIRCVCHSTMGPVISAIVTRPRCMARSVLDSLI